MPYVELVARVELPARDALLALAAAGQAAREADLVPASASHIGQAAAHRKADGRYYVFFDSPDPARVRDVLRAASFDQVTVVTALPASNEACANCGNISGSNPPAVCPACDFREIAGCPHCHKDHSRLDYAKGPAPRIWKCPTCNGLVRMEYNDPLELPDGRLNQPMIVLVRARP